MNRFITRRDSEGDTLPRANLGHDRSAADIFTAAVEEDAQAVAIP